MQLNKKAQPLPAGKTNLEVMWKEYLTIYIYLINLSPLQVLTSHEGAANTSLNYWGKLGNLVTKKENKQNHGYGFGLHFVSGEKNTFFLHGVCCSMV